MGKKSKGIKLRCRECESYGSHMRISHPKDWRTREPVYFPCPIDKLYKSPNSKSCEHFQLCIDYSLEEPVTVTITATTRRILEPF